MTKKRLCTILAVLLLVTALASCSSDADTMSFDISGTVALELQSGMDGTVVEVTEADDIAYITDTINDLNFQKDKAVDGDGWSYRIRWFGEDESLIEEIVVMNEYRICYNDFFWDGMEADHEIDIAKLDELLDGGE